MKKIWIFIILFIFIIDINASVNNSFNVSKKYVSNYYNKISDNKYFISNVPYEYNNETIKKNSGFINGGLLNDSEYNISSIEENTFLNDGISYWTLSGNVISSNNNLYNATKATIFVKNKMKVSGKGTYSEPWYFDSVIYTLTLDANGGSISASGNWIGTGSRVTKEIQDGMEYEVLPIPTNNGYKFGGWYTSKSGGTNVNEHTIISDDTTVYARWIDDEAPTCTLYANSNGVGFESKSDNIGVTQYGLSTNSNPTYNRNNILGLSVNTYYGYVKDAAGNTGKCSKTIVSTLSETYVASTYQYACGSYVCGSHVDYTYACGSYVCGSYSCPYTHCYTSCHSHCTRGVCCSNYCGTRYTTCYNYCTSYCYHWATDYCTSYCTGYNYATRYYCSSGYSKINDSYCYK